MNHISKPVKLTDKQFYALGFLIEISRQNYGARSVPLSVLTRQGYRKRTYTALLKRDLLSVADVALTVTYKANRAGELAFAQEQSRRNVTNGDSES